jgi:signal transduction histidine kinase
MDEERPKVFIKRAVTQAKKLSSLVSDLLDMSKIQTGKLPLNFEEFKFNEVLNDVITTANDTITTHKIEVIKNAQNIVINGDKQRIEQVLINLITNAVKYSPKAKKVFVTVDEVNNNLRVSVKDFGIGIAADQQDKIFSRFYRVEGTGSTFSGLGIGLYISKDIILKHNGRIWVESESGHGSTFYFELPEHQ